MSKVLYFATFAVGALVGFAASYKFNKIKCEKLVEIEIESIKQSYQKYYDEKIEKETKTKEEGAYFGIVDEEGYSCEPEQSETEVKTEPKEEAETSDDYDEPYVIAPEQYGDLDNYALVGLTYFNDGVLADDHGKKINNAMSVVGDFFNHFGEYEDDSVHIRNEKLETDYEILMDTRNYSDVYKQYR